MIHVQNAVATLKLYSILDTYMTQKYESLSFCEVLDEIDDTERLLLSLSVRLRVVSFLLKYFNSLDTLSALALGMGMAAVCPATLFGDDGRLSGDHLSLIPLTKFFIFSIALL